MTFRPFRLILAFALIFFAQSVKAQYYLTGENPASVKWRYLSGSYYKIIYPQEIDSLAQRYLFLLEKNRNAVMCGLKVSPKKIPVVLNPYTVASNGLVVWAPQRMEIYTQAPNSSYSQKWEEQLVLHESRHIGQMSLFTSKIYKPLSWILGDQSTGLGVALYPSKWFFEGDAVVAETELSKSGRGREASFLEYYRLAFLQDEHRSWNKWRYGSNKFFTPDIYALGYITNSVIRYQYSNYYLAGDFLSYLVRTPYNPFNYDVKYLDLSKVEYTKSIEMAKDVMGNIWREENKQRGVLSKTQDLGDSSKRSNYYYSYSQTTANGNNKYYLKKSYDRASNLIMIDGNNKEKRIRAFASSSKMKDIAKDKIYFTEQIPDKRWYKRSYSILYSYNTTNGKIQKLSSKTAYFCPSLSNTKDSIAVIENLINGKQQIVGLKALNGEILFKIQAPDARQITNICWANDSIYATAIGNKGLGLFSISVKDFDRNKWQILINEQYKNISFLSSCKDFIYFVSDADGVNNIYAFYPSSKIIRRLSNSKYGASSPYIQNDTLLMSQLSYNAIKPVKLALKDSSTYTTAYKLSLKNNELECNYNYIVADKLSEQAQNALKENNFSIYNLDSLQNFKASESKKYHKALNLFRIHSWGPLYYNVDKIMNMSFDKIYQAASLGATVYSQNTLGTAVTMLGYSYRKGFNAGHLKFTYSGLYPIIEFSTDINAEDRLITTNTNTGQINQLVLSSPLVETNLRTYIPFNFSSHGWNRGFIPQLSWKFENNQYYNVNTNNYNYRNQLSIILQYYQTRPIAPSAIFPEWGFGIIANAASAIKGGSSFGKVASVYAYAYAPGILLKQGLKISAGYQQQFIDGKSYYLSNLLNEPRGYDIDLYGKQYAMFSADYAIPFYLGDISLTGMIYLQRLDITPFIDFALCNHYNNKYKKDNWKNYYSYGADIMLRGIFFRIGAPIGIGLRYSRNGNNSGINIKQNNFELLFSLNL